jgi:hypothetical protein
MEFQFLGPLAVRADGRKVAVGSPKYRILLALLLRAGRTVPIGALAEAVGGDAEPGNPRRAVQLHIGRLRRPLPCTTGKDAREVIVTEVDDYLAGERPEQVDLGRFGAGCDGPMRLPGAMIWTVTPRRWRSGMASRWAGCRPSCCRARLLVSSMRSPDDRETRLSLAPAGTHGFPGDFLHRRAPPLARTARSDALSEPGLPACR